VSWFWLSVACSAVNFVYFRAFRQWGIQTFLAIAVNYLVCMLLGWLLMPEGQNINLQQPWLPLALLTGSLYVLMFWMIGRSAQRIGVAPTAIAAKLSMVIPVVAAFWWFDEPFSPQGLLALVLALAAVWFSAGKTAAMQLRPGHLRLPMAIFLGGGVADLLLKYTEVTYLNKSDYPFFLFILFGSSAIIGWTSVGMGLVRKQLRLEYKSVVAGILLGITNFFSVFGIIHAFKEMASSVLFPLNNLAIILISSALAAWIFRERLNRRQYAGALLAVLAILLFVFQ